MILDCPACAARYRLPDDAIPAEGKSVRCAKCLHRWWQLATAAPAEATDPSAAEWPAPLDEGDDAPAFAPAPAPFTAAAVPFAAAPAPFAAAPAPLAPPAPTAPPAAFAASSADAPVSPPQPISPQPALPQPTFAPPSIPPAPIAAAVPTPVRVAPTAPQPVTARRTEPVRPLAPSPAAASSPADASAVSPASASAPQPGGIDPSSERPAPAPRAGEVGPPATAAMPVPPSLRRKRSRWPVAGGIVAVAVLAGAALTQVPGLPPFDPAQVPLVGDWLAARLSPPPAPPSPLQLVATAQFTTLANGGRVVALSGEIVNPTAAPQAVSAVEALLIDDARTMIGRWRIPPPAATVAAGARLRFDSSASGFAPTVTRVTLRFDAAH